MSRLNSGDAPTGVTLSVVVPAFNEAGNVGTVVARLTAALADEPGYELLFVDDGSNDGTASALRALAAGDPRVRFIRLSRNFGHQQALRAGLAQARGACVVTMDADLQHPPELVPEMLRLWRGGARVVRTVRDDAGATPALKRWTAAAYYALLNAVSDYRIEPGSADFCLMDRTVVDVVSALPEREIFLRGILSWVGFSSATLHYRPARRHDGTSKYNLRRMLALAVRGLTSSSIQPLRLALLLSAAVASLSFIYMVYAVVVYVTVDEVVPGWASVIIVVSFLGAMQLLILGIIGEYLGRVLRETQGRPGYVIEEWGGRQPGRESGAAAPSGTDRQRSTS